MQSKCICLRHWSPFFTGRIERKNFIVSTGLYSVGAFPSFIDFTIAGRAFDILQIIFFIRPYSFRPCNTDRNCFFPIGENDRVHIFHRSQISFRKFLQCKTLGPMQPHTVIFNKRTWTEFPKCIHISGKSCRIAIIIYIGNIHFLIGIFFDKICESLRTADIKTETDIVVNCFLVDHLGFFIGNSVITGFLFLFASRKVKPVKRDYRVSCPS